MANMKLSLLAVCRGRSLRYKESATGQESSHFSPKGNAFVLLSLFVGVPRGAALS